MSHSFLNWRSRTRGWGKKFNHTGWGMLLGQIGPIYHNFCSSIERLNHPLYRKNKSCWRPNTSSLIQVEHRKLWLLLDDIPQSHACTGARSTDKDFYLGHPRDIESFALPIQIRPRFCDDVKKESPILFFRNREENTYLLKEQLRSVTAKLERAEQKVVQFDQLKTQVEV